MTNLVEKYREMKERGEKVTALTAYDYPTARLLDESGIDLILVGDSLGMVVLGYEDTTSVTLEEMLHHTRAVARGVKSALVVGDMPIHTFETPADAVATARKFIDAGAHAVTVNPRRRPSAAIAAATGLDPATTSCGCGSTGSTNTSMVPWLGHMFFANRTPARSSPDVTP